MPGIVGGKGKAPSKHEVRTATDGLDPQALVQLCDGVEKSYLRAKSLNANGRANPWHMTQDGLRRLRARGYG